MMRGQNFRATTPSGAGPRTNGPATPFVNEPRTPAAPRWERGADTPARRHTPGVARHFPPINAQNRRGRGRGQGRPSLPPIKAESIEDWVQRTGLHCLVVPTPVAPTPSPINGLQQGSAFCPNPVFISMDQVSQFPSVPMGFNPGMSNMMPVNQPSPYMFNPGVPIMPMNQPGTWAPPAGQHRANFENMTPMQSFPSPFDLNMITPPLPEYAPPNMYQEMGQFPPASVLRTPNGYVECDLDALTQQEPAIPVPVPGARINPSQQNLARCLENRLGIKNVYIRGFLPETTDEMLHGFAARFGKIERCKAIVDLDTDLCKGYY